MYSHTSLFIKPNSNLSYYVQKPLVVELIFVFINISLGVNLEFKQTFFVYIN